MARGVKLTQKQARRVGAVVRRVEAQRRDLTSTIEVDPLERRRPNQLFAVKVTISGGSAGSASSSCTYVYTVTTLSGRQLGTNLTPQRRRFANVAYTSTPANSIGAAYFDETGAIKLYDANELPAVEVCP